LQYDDPEDPTPQQCDNHRLKSYIHHREHQATAAMGQLAAGIEAVSRKAESPRLQAENHEAETVN